MTKIAKGAVAKATKKGYPKLFEKVGFNGFDLIHAHDKVAAQLVSELDECDQVIYVGYSDSHSNYPDLLASFVDCQNGKRFWVKNGVLQYGMEQQTEQL